ncbi:E3 ubiquitin-protein ligase Bre1-like [Watersipora subatra]|uniref:E3 ubiquitin-protein ligase Bre1-like n=1 Tax=Watersipora subatra TaxID=2589382 RepID=UPI00355B0FA3
MSTKRAHPESSSGPPTKKHGGYSDVVGSVSSCEEMNKKLLRFQNRKLAERIEVRRRAEADLRNRIDQLETRLTTDDDVLMIVNRYWNQLDEDIRVLLQRFDAETAIAREAESESTTSFLTQLATWDKEEMNEKLQQRVGFSKRAIGKLLQAFDGMQQRYESLANLLHDKASKDKLESEAAVKDEPKDGESGEEVKKEEADEIKAEPEDDGVKSEPSVENNSNKDYLDKMATLSAELLHLQTENKGLHEQATLLHEKHHSTTLQFTKLQEKVDRYETEIAELNNKGEDLQYDCETAKQRAHTLQLRLEQAEEQIRKRLQMIEVDGSSDDGVGTMEGVTKRKFNDMNRELEEQRELAAGRLAELETLQSQYQSSLRSCEQLTMDLKTLPESVILETTEYKCLKSQYSVLFNEAQQIKSYLDEARNLLHTTKNVHLRHIEQMESDELQCQKRLRTEIIQLEETLAQVRKEYEMSRIELEQTLAANEQTGPINREMRHLISSLQNHNRQLKAELQRYKRKFKDSQSELSKLRLMDRASPKPDQKSDISPSTSATDTRPAKDINTHELTGKKHEVDELVEKEKAKGKNDKDIVFNMKQQLKKAVDSQKEMKLLLDMYKSAPKEQKDKVQLMTAEKRARQEIDELKEHVKMMKENEKKEKRKLADGEALKKIKRYEEQLSDLRKELAHHKTEEGELLKEMELTGQAYEEKQEQNIRLVQQLKEKDDANFKLMSERIKSTQVHKLLKEEKDAYIEQVAMLQHQVEAQNNVVRKLEEKERILQSAISNLEKELGLRQQAMESFKRKAMESSQTAADLKLHLEKYHSQLREAQTAVADKTTALDQQSFKYRRIAEELASVKRKLERSEKIEQMGNTDEVLLEEIREYKEQLTCPSCKVKKKDAVLTKCFHVFCLECLKTRYETRQRKCPKCNAAFGANDYHRIYIS